MVEQPPKNAFLIGIILLVFLALLFLTFMGNSGIIKGTFYFVLTLGFSVFVVRMVGDSAGEAFEDLLMAMPVIRPLYQRFVKPDTMYRRDTRIMFQESVHRALTSTIDGIRTGQGLRALAPEEVRPVSPIY